MYKLAQFNINPGQSANTTSEVFVAQPDAYKETLAGRLFILAEIELDKVPGMKIINFIINNLNHNYYQNEKILLREKIPTLKAEHIFESALAKTNKHLDQFLAGEKIKVGYSSLHITAGIILADELHFAVSGRNKALLIHKAFKPDGAAQPPNPYNVADITGNTPSTENNNVQSPKLFSSVISGHIPAGGYLFFTNETLPEYLSREQLIKIITTLPPMSAVEQLKNILENVNTYVSFMGIIFKNTRLQFDATKRTTSQSPETHAASPRIRENERKAEKAVNQVKYSAALSNVEKTDSIAMLNDTEARTEKLLTPSGIFNFKKRLSSSGLKMSHMRRNKREGYKPPKIKENAPLLEKRRTAFIKIITGGIKNTGVNIANVIFYAIKLLTDKNTFYNAWQLFKRSVVNSLRNTMLWFGHLDKKHKILLFMLLVCAVVLSRNLVLMDNQNKEMERQEKYNELISLIEQKQNQVEANLLYNNNEDARELLGEIEGLVNELSGETEKEVIKQESFRQKYDEQLEKLQKVYRITDVNALSDFAALSDQAYPESISLIVSKNRIYAGDTGEKSIYILDLTENLVTTLTDMDESVLDLSVPTVFPDSIKYFNNGSILDINTNNEEIISSAITLAGDFRDVVDMANYNNRIYLLNPKNNQIYRHGRVGQNYGSGMAWIQDASDISESVSLSIDGHIYILTRGCDVLKFMRGNSQEFKLTAVDPPLESCSKLFVSPESDYIYILELSAKRLVMFNKSGQFILQYQSESWDNPIDFAVNENSGIIYILNDAKIYSFEGSHFEE